MWAGWKRKALHQRITMIRNNPICTHLSNQIILNQCCLGRDDPGMTSNTVVTTSQQMAGIKEKAGLLIFAMIGLYLIWKFGFPAYYFHFTRSRKVPPRRVRHRES